MLAVVKPGIGGRGLLERANEQQRGDDQHQRQRDLRGDERVAQPEPLSIGGGVGAVQHRREVGAQRVTRRRQPEDQSGDQGDAERERHHPALTTKFRLIVNGNAGSEPASSATSQNVKRHRHDGGDGKQHHRLGQQLAINCPRPAPTASRVAISRRRVAARASSMPATLLHAIASSAPVSAKRKPMNARNGIRTGPGMRPIDISVDGVMLRGVGLRLLEIFVQRVELGFCLRHRDARLEAADGDVPDAVAPR